jgi:hypothetical protein
MDCCFDMKNNEFRIVSTRSNKLFHYKVLYDNLLNKIIFRQKYKVFMDEYKNTEIKETANKQSTAIDLLSTLDNEIYKKDPQSLKNIFSSLQKLLGLLNGTISYDEIVHRLKEMIILDGIPLFLSDRENIRFIEKNFIKDDQIFVKNIIRINSNLFSGKYVDPVFFEIAKTLKEKSNLAFDVSVTCNRFSVGYSSADLFEHDKKLPFTSNGITFSFYTDIIEDFRYILLAYLAYPAKTKVENTVDRCIPVAFYGKDVLKDEYRVLNPQYSCCESKLTIKLKRPLNDRYHEYLTAVHYYPNEKELFIINIPIENKEFRFGEKKYINITDLMKDVNVTKEEKIKFIKIHHMHFVVIKMLSDGITRITEIGRSYFGGWIKAMKPSVFLDRCRAFKNDMPEYLMSVAKKIKENPKLYMENLKNDYYVKLALEDAELQKILKF